MGLEIKSEWMETWVEILKTLHSLDYNGFNEDLKTQDYINLEKTKIMIALTEIRQLPIRVNMFGV